MSRGAGCRGDKRVAVRVGVVLCRREEEKAEGEGCGFVQTGRREEEKAEGEGFVQTEKKIRQREKGRRR